MVRPQTVRRSVKEAIKSSDRLPNETTYATFELDQTGGQSNVRPPAVEIQTIDAIRVRPHNSDLHAMATDANGNEIGYIFRAQFEMELEIDVWTREGAGYDPDEIGHELRFALYEYDNTQLANPLPDPDNPSETLSDVSHFFLNEGAVADDLTMTPALRRWRQTADVWFYEEIDTSQEYGEQDFIADVTTPEDGDMVGGSVVDVLFDATPSIESEADNF